jgi:hypothetical protein
MNTLIAIKIINFCSSKDTVKMARKEENTPDYKSDESFVFRIHEQIFKPHIKCTNNLTENGKKFPRGILL